MPELLLELGCEELPAVAVRRAYTDLFDAVTASCRAAGILGEDGTAMGTPRRLIVSLPDLMARQPDAIKEQRGPALKSAFGADGEPTPALLGFCRAQGVDVADLRRDDQYVWISKAIPGRPTDELLAELLSKAIRGLSFDKTMRWGTSRMRFARPIRWILAAFDGECVPFEIEGVASDVLSRGHRFYAPLAFEARTLQDLVSSLRERKVEPEADIRRERILAQTRAVADGAPEMPEALVEENTFLTEWPTAVQGTFREEFEILPDSVLVTAMAKHERMFPVRDAEGRLTNRFVFIRNSGEDDAVRAGCAWVLNARFNDAKFFFDEDAKFTMEQFLAKTGSIVFQDRLGSVLARADRLADLSAAIAASTGADDEEVGFARAAGRYAKADLSTGLVGELPALQGVIGGAYLRREGIADATAHAVSTQYDLAKNPVPNCPGARTAVRLVIVDQLDKLAGYLGIGLTPTGSSDPFALRRAATLLIEAAWQWPAAFPAYWELFEWALEEYRRGGVNLDEPAARSAFYSLLASRYSAMMPEVRYDILEAAIGDAASPRATSPQAVRFRTRVMARLAKDGALVQTATRPINITEAARKKGIAFGRDLSEVDASVLESETGTTLCHVLAANQDALAEAERTEDEAEVIRLLQSLAEPITHFFDSTMVMVDNPAVRYARLTLLGACSQQLLIAGDFSKIVQ